MTSEVVFIGGRSGVGKTSVGHEVHARLSAADVPHCLIDGDFLDMAHPPPWEHRLAERNLAAMWGNYRALGYRRMIYVNTVSVRADVIVELATAMGDHPAVSGILLTCTDDTVRQRLGQREIGSTLDRHVRDSTETADLLDTTVPEWVVRIPTDERPVADIAAQIIESVGWLSSGRE